MTKQNSTVWYGKCIWGALCWLGLSSTPFDGKLG